MPRYKIGKSAKAISGRKTSPVKVFRNTKFSYISHKKEKLILKVKKLQSLMKHNDIESAIQLFEFKIQHNLQQLGISNEISNDSNQLEVIKGLQETFVGFKSREVSSKRFQKKIRSFLRHYEGHRDYLGINETNEVRPTSKLQYM